MSLLVSDAFIAQAQHGTLAPKDFISCVKESLPRAWALVEGLVAQKQADPAALASYGVGRPLDEETRGELLRMCAGTAIRTSVERHFGVVLAFQNCHNAAVFLPEELQSKEYEMFTSVEAQILNQRPEFRHC